MDLPEDVLQLGDELEFGLVGERVFTSQLNLASSLNQRGDLELDLLDLFVVNGGDRDCPAAGIAVARISVAGARLLAVGLLRGRAVRRLRLALRGRGLRGRRIFLGYSRVAPVVVIAWLLCGRLSGSER